MGQTCTFISCKGTLLFHGQLVVMPIVWLKMRHKKALAPFTSACCFCVVLVLSLNSSGTLNICVGQCKTGWFFKWLFCITRIKRVTIHKSVHWRWRLFLLNAHPAWGGGSWTCGLERGDFRFDCSFTPALYVWNWFGPKGLGTGQIFNWKGRLGFDPTIHYINVFLATRIVEIQIF